MSSPMVLKLSAVVVTAALVTPISPSAHAAKTPKLKPIAGREDATANTILNGRGAPKPTLGVDGDFYIDISTFTIYGPKKNNKWPVGVNLKGPQGDAGKIGERGASGSSGVASKGDKGDKGERGEKGEKGDRGEKGESGASGATGATGPAGPQGATGAQGATGPSGANGAAGTAGSTGPQGLQGLKGDKGDTGDTGAQGPIGPKGDTGDTGTPGSTGAKGDPGPSNVNVVSVPTFTILASAGVENKSALFGSIQKDKMYSFEILVKGTVSSSTALNKYFGSYIEGSEAGLVIQSTFTVTSTSLAISTSSAEDVYQFRWVGTVKGATGTAKLRVVLYHLDGSQEVTASGSAYIHEVGSIS